MIAVQNLCSRVVLIRSGRVALSGSVDETVQNYLQESSAPVDSRMDLDKLREPGFEPIIRDVWLENGDGVKSKQFFAGNPVIVRINYASQDGPLRNPHFGVFVESVEGQRLFFLQTKLQHGLLDQLPQSGTISCLLDELPLSPGDYVLSFGCSIDRRQADRVERALRFNVAEQDYYGSGYLPAMHQGPILVRAKWILPT